MTIESSCTSCDSTSKVSRRSIWANFPEAVRTSDSMPDTLTREFVFNRYETRLESLERGHRAASLELRQNVDKLFNKLIKEREEGSQTHDGTLPLPTSASPSSLALAEHLQAGSKAYDRLVENIKGDWLVVDPSSPLVVTPSSSTVQTASRIIVKLPPSVDRESRIEDHQKEEDASGSEVESEAEEEDDAESSEEWSVGEGEDFDPKLAKLEIALLRAKLKLVRLELAQARGDVDRKTSKKSVTVDAPLSYLESIE